MQTEQFHLNYEIELRHWWFVARRRILRGLLSQIVPACPETVVVDVGCGTGGNIAYNAEEYERYIHWGLALSPKHEVLVEEAVIGWKED